MHRPLPTQAVLHEWFNYEPDTGVFRWKKTTVKQIYRMGQAAGTTEKRYGYITIGVPGYGRFGAHRLAWVYVHGLTIGGAEIDHIDTNPSNNAIKNLRLATSVQQKQNSKAHRDNASGLKGAYRSSDGNKKGWRSQIRVRGKLICLGRFYTAQQAHEAYAAASLKYFGEFARSA